VPPSRSLLLAGKFAPANAETFVVAKKRQANLANTAEADSRAMAFTDVQVSSGAGWAGWLVDGWVAGALRPRGGGLRWVLGIWVLDPWAAVCFPRSGSGR
jgi:hypothetical protein